MCGFGGFLDRKPHRDREEMRAIVERMGGTLEHRGPDDHDVWLDPARGVALAHQRLAVLDLSPSGRQPMKSASGRLVMAYNGEVYNHAALRRELEAEGHTFRGRSDTETLVEACECWGIRRTVARSNGMFAMAVWDSARQQLTLARDRLGIKPLYYGLAGDTLVFASELKAIRAYPEFTADVDRGALTAFLQHGYVPAPLSIYRGIQKLPPGTVLTVSAGWECAPGEPSASWSLRETAERGAREPFAGSPPDAVAHLDSLLHDSVRLRRMSDVPLGAFLSGGVDSSTVVAILQDVQVHPVKTFTIGFREPRFDESGHARQVAAHLQTDHVSLDVTSADARSVIPRLPAMYDEPFGDASQIPTHLVSRLAREHVTVALSGDGGDELFGGYDRYALAERVWNRIGWLPYRWRCGASRLLTRMGPRKGRHGRNVQTLARFLATADGPDLYTDLHSHWHQPARIVVGGSLPSTTFSRRERWAARDTLRESMMYLDGATYLPDDILVKVDRASMSVSLEARVPLLDHRIVEFAWTLPASWRGSSKPILRQLLGRYVPPVLFDRPKVGFGAPVGSWLRGPLRGWAEDLLSEPRLRREGFLEPRPIREKWEQHLAGTHEWPYHLWDVLMFQAWLAAT